MAYPCSVSTLALVGTRSCKKIHHKLMERSMNIEEMKGLGKDYLTPKEVAGCLGCTAYAINQQAASDASKLGFQVVIIGKRVKIPRKAFVRFMEGETE